jgi:hypothetical protein
MYTVEITPVDLTQPVDLPHPWPQLQAKHFHHDLIELAQRYLLQADRLGFGELGREVLGLLGAGFLTPFDRKQFEHLIGGPYANMQSKVLDVLEGLSQEFGDRISSVVWDSFAFLGTVPDPTIETTILSRQESLTHPYWIVDSCLHAVGKAYRLLLHIETCMSRAGAGLFEHGCGCDCRVAPSTQGTVEYHLAPVLYKTVSFELWSHTLSETLLIGGLHMPFAMGRSPYAADVMRLQGKQTGVEAKSKS